ncbi:interferon-induced very large GTPase 1-like protein [Labeo rohita]|uniref:Interferon-induced very large GTPase 1-like protein n=1 Tax=Labeo rohita TaxID=84645 RepID=A0A498LPF9_LABRO|nr:interferon-induced very large GTPase 1-like protein [Labeo rohita]
MDHSVKIVLFGNSAAVQFQPDNILLGEIQTNIENAAKSKTVPLQMKKSGHRVSVINLIGLHETALNLDPLTGQLVNENNIIAFIFVVQLGQLTDADKMGIEWLQRVFGDRVLQFVMILFTYESQEESDSIIDDLKKNSALDWLIEKCGGRYHTCSKNMNKPSEMKDLMTRIEQLFIENEQQCYTSEMYNTALREGEDLQNKTCQRGSCFETTHSAVFLIPMLVSVLVLVPVLGAVIYLYYRKKKGGYKKANLMQFGHTEISEEGLTVKESKHTIQEQV